MVEVFLRLMLVNKSFAVTTACTDLYMALADLFHYVSVSLSTLCWAQLSFIKMGAAMRETPLAYDNTR